MLCEGTGRDGIKQNSAKVKCSEHMTPGRSLDTDGFPWYPHNLPSARWMEYLWEGITG